MFQNMDAHMHKHSLLVSRFVSLVSALNSSIKLGTWGSRGNCSGHQLVGEAT